MISVFAFITTAGLAYLFDIRPTVMVDTFLDCDSGLLRK